ncbi:MAG: hypothetical protein QOI82_3363 [Actinomycetota bacterium]|jgi:hypothetical protein|nr:hypothetical protein [Actinomycetota bacterium]
MSRIQILVLSAVCCAFGALALWGPHTGHRAYLVVNGILAVALIFIAGHDLKARGWRFGYLIGLTYLLPLIGLVTYLSLSDRPRVGAERSSVTA